MFVTGKRHPLPGLAVSASLRDDWKLHKTAVKAAERIIMEMVTNLSTFYTPPQQDQYDETDIKKEKQINNLRIC